MRKGVRSMDSSRLSWIKSTAKVLLKGSRRTFRGSADYWEKRYSSKGNSGSGSYGRLATFKAEFINHLVVSENIKSVIDFGCGDGNQLSLANYPNYVGFDVSKESVRTCRKKFAKDASKTFFHTSDFDKQRADLSLSLDVIYHLVEDRVYEQYMKDLFKSSNRFVVIYSSNHDEDSYVQGSHERHRNFTRWIEKNSQEFKIVRRTPNKYPYTSENPNETSLADFYVYEK
jgi:SAM-dependent methyltransferase